MRTLSTPIFLLALITACGTPSTTDVTDDTDTDRAETDDTEVEDTETEETDETLSTDDTDTVSTDETDAACAALATDIAALSEPGSDPWDAQVKVLLVGCYDADISGLIDTTPELAGVTCAVWEALEAAAQAGYTTPFLDLYGFTDGLIYIGDGLGFDELVRTQVVTAFEACP